MDLDRGLRKRIRGVVRCVVECGVLCEGGGRGGGGGGGRRGVRRVVVFGGVWCRNDRCVTYRGLHERTFSEACVSASFANLEIPGMWSPWSHAWLCVGCGGVWCPVVVVMVLVCRGVWMLAVAWSREHGAWICVGCAVWSAMCLNPG